MVAEVGDTKMEFAGLVLDNDDSLSENDDDELDGDAVSETELLQAFNKPYKLSVEKAVTLSRNYILHMSCTSDTEPSICIGLSDNTCEVYRLTTSGQLTKQATLDSHKDGVVNVKFSNNNSLYTGSADGCIKLWDLRDPLKSVVDFTDSSATNSNQVKQLTCFDVSPNNRLLCGGTELYEGDAYLLFWDIRNRKLLGGYWETHSNDITSVTFHPSDVNRLATGSTDGLINVYNLQEPTEDDALDGSLNTESSVDRVLWYGDSGVCCVTHTADLQLWDTALATRYHTFTRQQIAVAGQRQSAEHCYVAGVHSTSADGLLMLAGSNFHNGECVRTMTVQDNTQLIPCSILTGNRQRIRASWYNSSTGVLITGGEHSVLSVWQPGSTVSSSQLKSTTTKQKIHTQKPY
ncbi:uncharacterized protein CBL_04482 [Carabus blaptoides fortunei]